MKHAFSTLIQLQLIHSAHVNLCMSYLCILDITMIFIRTKESLHNSFRSLLFPHLKDRVYLLYRQIQILTNYITSGTSTEGSVTSVPTWLSWMAATTNLALYFFPLYKCPQLEIRGTPLHPQMNTYWCAYKTTLTNRKTKCQSFTLRNTTTSPTWTQFGTFSSYL